MRPQALDDETPGGLRAVAGADVGGRPLTAPAAACGLEDLAHEMRCVLDVRVGPESRRVRVVPGPMGTRRQSTR